MDNQSESPPNLQKKLSEAEKKNVLLNFMGNAYGDLKKLEGFIIGPSTSLEKRNSEKIKQHISNVITSKSSQSVLPPQPPVQVTTLLPEPVPVVEEKIIITPQSTVTASSEADPQLYFNFDPSEKELLLKKIDQLYFKVDQLCNIVNQLIKNARVVSNIETIVQPTNINKKKAK